VLSSSRAGAPPARGGGMRRVERLLLGLLSSVVTVFVACAYGVPFSFQKTGRVRASGTQDGIGGIQVFCADPAVDRPLAVSAPDGRFYLPIPEGDRDCTTLRFEDADGAANGAWQPRLVTGVAGDQDGIDVELDPVP
jgi:hypothetical protein